MNTPNVNRFIYLALIALGISACGKVPIFTHTQDTPVLSSDTPERLPANLQHSADHLYPPMQPVSNKSAQLSSSSAIETFDQTTDDDVASKHKVNVEMHANDFRYIKLANKDVPPRL